MSYPGNSALARDTQERILETFHQTLELARHGKLQEAALGCDFILKMDRQFELAKVLQSRLQGAEGPIDVGDLVPAESPSNESAPAGAPPPPAAAPAATTSAPPAAPSEAASPRDTQPQAIFNEAAASESDHDLMLDLDSEGMPALDQLSALDLGDTDLEAPSLAPPTAGGSAPSGDRISGLLAEGRAAFDQGEYQAAIDAWSRIFLVDIDHAEATQLIEGARKLKAEHERKVDELMHEATQLRDLGKKEEARAAFERVLEIHPSHLAAREYLQQLDSPAPGAAPASLQQAPAEADDSEDGLYDPLEDEQRGDAPVAAPTSLKPPPPTAGQSSRQKPGRSFVGIGLAVFAGLLVGGWLLYANWGRLFPNTADVGPPEAPTVIQEASRLHIDGKTEEALEMLRALGTDHPLHDRAQLLIERWGTDLESQPDASDVADAGLPEEQRLARDAHLERARRLYDSREYLQAAKAFQSAERIEPLEGATADLYDDTKRQLLPIAQQITLFRQREWERLLGTLWRKLQDEPGNRDVKRILANSYYNLGVRALRRGNAEEARDNFSEMVQLIDDPLGERLLLFAESYSQYPEDLLFRIYVGKLEFRQ